MLNAPKLWKNLSEITIATLESPWYYHLARLENTISCETYEFYRNKGLITMHLPITTGSISSPMGKGSDSSPVRINLFGVETYLTDSMQFMLEYGCRIHEQGCYYVMPSFRGENADECHLCQFYHSEVEIPGTVDDIIALAEEYVIHISKKLLENNRVDVLAIAGDVRHIEEMIEKEHFDRITVDEAINLFETETLEDGLYEVDDKYGYRNITRKGERFLIDKFNGFVWLTNFDHLAVPFYQAFDHSKTKALNADLLFGVGEVIGSGERHFDSMELHEALKMHDVSADEYQWYMQMKTKKPLNTSGFGMGIERYLLWVLKHDDIRDLQILPRFNGVDCKP